MSEDVTVKRPFIGVPTTTPVAFSFGGRVYLERMNLLSEDGAGILCHLALPQDSVLPIAFHLSTAARPIQCDAVVMAARATTPAGWQVLLAHGEEVFSEAMDVGDSVTQVIRLEPKVAEAKVAEAKDPLPTQEPGPPGEGVCVRFLRLDAASKLALHTHLDKSQRLQAEVQNKGARWRKVSDIAAMFDEDSTLSDKAKDW